MAEGRKNRTSGNVRLGKKAEFHNFFCTAHSFPNTFKTFDRAIEVYEVQSPSHESRLFSPVSQKPDRERKYRPTGITRYTIRDAEGLANETITAINATTGISMDRR